MSDNLYNDEWERISQTGEMSEKDYDILYHNIANAVKVAVNDDDDDDCSTP